jgi:hypothetical protein
MTAPLAIALLLVSAAVAARRRRRRRLPAQATIISPRKSTVIAQDGTVRSVQSAVLMTPRARLERMWGPANLENLARTYWRFLSRVTLGLIRVVYGANERAVVLLGRPLTLLRFEAPDYVLDGDHGSVTWQIRDGLLVARRGRGCGYLRLDVRRETFAGSDQATVRIEMEVANFYPAIAARFSMPVYMATQSVVHVLVTHSFLRSLATLDLAESKVKRLADPRLTTAPAADGAPSSDGPGGPPIAQP